MLKALLDSPRDAGSELTWRDRALTSTVLMSVFASTRLLLLGLYNLAIVQLQLSALAAAGYFLLLSIALTVIVYVACVCLLPFRDHFLLLCGLCKESDSPDASTTAATAAGGGTAVAVAQAARATWSDFLFGRWAVKRRNVAYARLPADPAPGVAVASASASAGGTYSSLN